MVQAGPAFETGNIVLRLWFHLGNSDESSHEDVSAVKIGVSVMYEIMSRGAVINVWLITKWKSCLIYSDFWSFYQIWKFQLFDSQVQGESENELNAT